MATDTTVMGAVRRKCNVSWDDQDTSARLEDVVEKVSSRLAPLLGFESSHAFSSSDGQSWGLFLDGCLYEFSDAWDDFTENYAREIQSVRMYNMAVSADA